MYPNCTYNDRIGMTDLAKSSIEAAASCASAALSAGANIPADIACALSSVKNQINLWKQWTSHPAADAKDFIKNAKPTLVNIDPYDRIVKVIGFSQRINPKAIDVNTREFLRWYKQNYKDDYLSLSPEVKIYFNEYLDSIRTTYGNVNRIFEDLDAAAFTTTEINVNATPIETVENLLTNLTAPGSNVKYVLYGGIGLLFVYLLSSKR
jgi:hypothetical protein